MSANDVSLRQLQDMGIPRGRAQAALNRSKGDAMAAAWGMTGISKGEHGTFPDIQERVFSGEFDDIASDDEGEPVTANPQSGLRTPDSTSQGEDSDHDVSMPSDGEEDTMSDNDGEGFELDEFMDEDGAAACLDPYANVFFSKERTETMLEPALKPIYAQIPIPNGEENAGQTMRVRVLSRGEWMSGCPEGNEQSFLFQLYEKLTSGKFACPNNCGHKFDRSPEDFFALLPDFPAYVSHLERHIQRKCPKCKSNVCSACEDPVREPSPVKGGSPDGNESKALFHCPTIQGAILGVSLHMIEQEFGSQLRVEKPAGVPPAKKRKTSALGKLLNTMQGGDDDSSDSDGGYGFGGLGGRGQAAPKGTGYSGAAHEDRSGEIAAEKSQFLKDQTTAKLMSQVRAYLPAVKRGHTTDLLVHPTALAHLRRRSSFVSDLLRNDSLMDMSNRAEIYHALFDWLEVVSSHEVLASMLAMPQMRAVKAIPGPDDDTVEVTYEGAPSPRELLETVVIQATAALKGLSSTSGPEESDQDSDELDPLQQSLADAQKRKEKQKVNAMTAAGTQNAILTAFCDRILDARTEIDRLLVATKGRAFVNRMLESLPRLYETEEDQPKIETSATDETTMKVYEEWAQRVRFRYCDLHDPGDQSKIKYAHAYNNNIQTLVGTDAPKRSLAIAKELAILTTSLPAAWGSTIFIRVDDARVDCIKAMIIGPEGTPYENGCFLFDIFLPLDYNHSCPLVKSMTTNGGKYRYNPNLYADGKVCLSLLGTWSGPGWISGKSTLLQVLISIQSLIFCDEPYLNEPGWANQAGTASSKAYSANVRRMVLVDAMANNLKNPPFPFENEIKTHFRLKAKAIRAQLDRWKAEDDGKPTNRDYFGVSPPNTASGASSSQTPFDVSAKHLRSLLDELDPVELSTAATPLASGPAAGPSTTKAKKTRAKSGGKGTRASSRLKAKK